MPQFVLLAGVHADKNGVFAPGDVVESDTDLETRFPEKFTRWSDDDERADPPVEEEE